MRNCGKLLIVNSVSAPVAQLDRASGYEPEGREFESPRAHHFNSCCSYADFRQLLLPVPNAPVYMKHAALWSQVGSLYAEGFTNAKSFTGEEHHKNFVARDYRPIIDSTSARVTVGRCCVVGSIIGISQNSRFHLRG